VFDPEVLLDPFEEEFDPPAQLVKLRNNQRGQIQVIGQKHQHPPILRVTVTHSTQAIGVMRHTLWIGEPDNMVAAKPDSSVHRSGLQAIETDAGFGACDKEGGFQHKFDNAAT